MRFFHVVADETRGETLRDALTAAVATPPDAVPAGDTDDLALVVRRPTGGCTYVWTSDVRDRHVRWLLAVREEEGFAYGLVVHWSGGAAALELEGLDLVGECPGHPGVTPPAQPADRDGTRTVRVGSLGPWVDVPQLSQLVANGARFSLELLREPLRMGIYPDPPEQGEFERRATPARGVEVETRRLGNGARYLRREADGVTSVYVLVEIDEERWLCGCDGSLEAVCLSCRAAP
ncbi:MAG: hypothetical protein H6721_32415 [Sandaracinus sp.]|nr:hypothetical protein [Sandaracinus sp.]